MTKIIHLNMKGDSGRFCFIRGRLCPFFWNRCADVNTTPIVISGPFLNSDDKMYNIFWRKKYNTREEYSYTHLKYEDADDVIKYLDRIKGEKGAEVIVFNSDPFYNSFKEEE